MKKSLRQWAAISAGVCALLWVSGGRAAASGRELFSKNCAQCHGKDGHGFTPMGKQLHIKDLTQSKLADPQIRSQILEGAKDAKGVVRMAPFKDKLSAAEIDQLAAFVKGLRQ